jgi:cell fate (sporulation/competence/biofilm development) regulator YlbF (YheA/YmcA/DUF963 family)
MSTQTENTTVTQKTRELCQAILDQPDVRAMRKNIETFMADTRARGQYETLMEEGQKLHEKQHSGEPLKQSDVDAFDKLRNEFIQNPVSRGFLDAQEDMRKLQQQVTRYVSKTFELGHVPDEAELDSGCCDGEGGGGCGCHH